MTIEKVKIEIVLIKLSNAFGCTFTDEDIEFSLGIGIINEDDVYRDGDKITHISTTGLWNMLNVY